ncbi:protein sisterless A-like [Cochliomyia hominivorax]
MDPSIENGYFLQQIFTSLTQDLEMQTFNPANSNNLYMNPQNINRLVEMEMKRIKENCMLKEQQYVEQMLSENPITIERRPNNNHMQQQQQYNSSEDDNIDVVTVSTNIKKETNTFLQQQRAEACRRSRYNNKVKKAKSKYRHKFISKKLLQSIQMLDCIQDLIAQAENHLLTQGLTRDKLQYLRHNCGLGKVIGSIRKLETALKMEQ